MFDLLLFLFRFGAVAVLYLFLWQALKIMVRDLEIPQPQAQGLFLKKGFYLVVLEPGKSSLQRRQKFYLSPDITIGRDPQNHVVIEDPYVSSQHALITCREGRWCITDLNSTNGTYVNGKRVQENEPLNHGDMVRIGTVIFKVGWEE
ncbi:MAG TPA: FHA domain-containing protein [Moorella mulderi]|nr:FHA domain-containing protein [Moorella mulderi]